MLIPTCDRFTPAWPKSGDDAPEIPYRPLERVFADAYPDDRHFAAYSVPDIPSRLSYGAVEECDVCMVLAVFDVDDPGKVGGHRRESWTVDTLTAVEKLFEGAPGYAFTTRGGIRIVYTLPEPVVIATELDIERWRVRYRAWCDILVEDYEIRADRSCVDWTRLYRLPRVVRDGVLQIPIEIGAIGPWWPHVEVSHVTITERTGALPTPLGQDPEDVERAIATLAAAWPAGGTGQGLRHRASLALSGALIKGGWSVDDTAHFVNAVSIRVGEGDDLGKRLKMARDSEHAGERAAGWGSLAELIGDASDRTAGVLGGGAAIAAAFDESTENAPAASTCDAPSLHGVACSCPTPPPAQDLPDVELTPWESALADARERVQAAIGLERPSNVAPLFMHGLDVLRAERQPVRWLVRGLVTVGGLTIVGGEPKTAKTWLLMTMAICIASGAPLFGSQPVAGPQRVAYFFAEDDLEAVRSRMTALCHAMDLDVETVFANLLLCPRGRFLDLMRDDDLALVVASCTISGPVGAVILEPLRDLHSGEEDKSDAIGPLFKRLRLIGEIIGETQKSPCTPMIAHHMKKQGDGGSKVRGGQRLRGSSAMHGSVVNGIYLGDVKTEVGSSGSVFTNTVESEIKGGRSMGVFSATLKVTDGADDTAVHAAWTIDRDGGASTMAKDDAREQQILEIIRSHPEKHLPSLTALYQIVGGKKERFNAMISLMMAGGLIATSDRHPVHGNRVKKNIVVLGPNAGIGGGGEASQGKEEQDP